MVYRRRFNEFCSVANAILGDRELAKDAVQDAFASALVHKRQWRRRGPIDAWLWRAVVNAAYDQRRTRRDPSAASHVDRAIAAGASSGTDPAANEVAEALAGLPERQRLVLFLRYYGNLDYKSIAQILDLKTGTVAATIHQGRASLKRRLEVALDH
jgi:RNA polymerase sigma-70 factor (ECF subfamily)